MIQDEISALAEKIASNPDSLDGHSAIVLADYEGGGCIAVGTQMGVSKLILNTMIRNASFASSVLACAEVFKQDRLRVLKEMATVAES